MNPKQISSLADSLPPAIFVLGVIGAFIVTGRYHLKTAEIVRHIQALYGKEGRAWPFWTDTKRHMQLFYAPEDLIDTSDGEEIVAAKKRLIAHRKATMKTVMCAWGIMFLTFIGCVSVPIFCGLYLAKYYPH